MDGFVLLKIVGLTLVFAFLAVRPHGGRPMIRDFRISYDRRMRYAMRLLWLGVILVILGIAGHNLGLASGLVALAVGLLGMRWFWRVFSTPGDRVVNSVLTTIVVFLVACLGTAIGVVLIVRAL